MDERELHIPLPENKCYQLIREVRQTCSGLREVTQEILVEVPCPDWVEPATLPETEWAC